MNTTKTCDMLTDFLMKNNCIEFISLPQKTKHILESLYNDIDECAKYINKHKSRILFYDLKIHKITNASDIPKPVVLKDGLTKEVESHIDKHAYTFLKYNLTLLDFPLLKRNITIYFIIEKKDVDIQLDFEPDLKKFHVYVDKVLLLYLLLGKHSNVECSPDLSVYLYFTSLKKMLSTKNEVLNYNHVNTGFTYTCPSTNGEIVIFRKEEWFKVLIHESFHNLHLDFSGMNNDHCVKMMHSVFNVPSDVNLFESYTEIWAKILNVLIFSYKLTPTKKTNHKKEVFYKYCEFLLNYERSHCFFQMAKVLDYHGFTYEEVLNKSEKIKMYRENTNVFTYYVITTILLNCLPDFFNWCFQHNKKNTILQFTHTDKTLVSFCNFIEEKYKLNNFIENVNCSNKLFHVIKEKRSTNKKTEYVLNNLRLALLETI